MEWFIPVLAAALIAIGATFALLAGVGILVMPDLFTRLQAAAKASTLGTVCILIGAALHLWQLELTVRALTVTLFLFLTAPIAAHIIGRAGYLAGARLADETRLDEWRGRDEQTQPGAVSSTDEP